MSLGEFSLDKIGREIPPVDASATPRVDVAELEAVFELLDEEIVLVERASGDILWMSQACRAITHKLGSSRNIAEFPELARIIHASLPSVPCTRLHARWHPTEAAWQHRIGDDRPASVAVFCRAGDPHHVWVRFTHYSDRDDYFRQYIADRDRLFSTSRSISVGEMATTLAHELNQPLGSLRNIVHGVRSRLLSGNAETEEILDALKLAEKQGRYADDVLSRARSFARSRQPTIERFDLNELVRDTIRLLDWVFQDEGISVGLETPATHIHMHGDATLLQQVLVNLLRNAVESMAAVDFDGHTVTIVTGCEGDAVRLEIADTGEGIDEDHEKTLFTPFRSAKPDGMGVGLNICRSFIELHAGKFWFTRNPDRGSTAHIALPRRGGADAAAVAAARRPAR